MLEPTTTDEPQIRFAGRWLPAHQAREKLAVAIEAMERVERFNERFPDLATAATLGVVPRVRRRLARVKALALPLTSKDAKALRKKAHGLLGANPPEDVIDALQEDFASSLNLQTLVAMVGMPAYLEALHREALVLRQNRISAEQIAVLWNDLARFAPGGGRWTERWVQRLLANQGKWST
ncbi:MAG: hypothetical protein P8106_11810 [Gammaproteobacteria bacterium]